MKKRLSLLFFLFIISFAKAQNIRLWGNINDTTSKNALPNALLMAVKFKDSMLVNFTRTTKEGLFKPIKVPLDTYIVIISHPNFSDKTYLLVPNKTDTAFNFKNVVLPPRSVVLNEVEIFAYKEKSYYKGDTLIFTADSFKTRPNATVEDLLKKLPGVKVDAAGKITIQGKEVDQVLVDGDEFFGSDPTIATRNLNATTVDNIQVYDKKNEDPESTNETLKVVNLKLKDDAKKGYFGKATAAGDFQKFYENDLLLNKFRKQQKISIFGLFANTPKQGFNGGEAYKYGLDNEGYGNYDPETNTWTSFGDNGAGIPNTLKTGFYFNDKLGKNTKINTDYTFNQTNLISGSETNTQFFLADTNYTNAQVINTTSKNISHVFNLNISQKLDSLTELIAKPKITYKKSTIFKYQNDDFISEENELTRQTTITNNNNSESIDASLSLKLNRKFMKKDRLLTINYQPTYYTATSNSNLNTNFLYYKNQLPDSTLIQKRTQSNYRSDQSAGFAYTEPIGKKFKIESGYNFSYNLNNTDRKTRDYNGQNFETVNPTQSNNFHNTRITNRVYTKLIYEVKKYKIGIGTLYRNVFQQNINVTNTQTLSQTFNNILPYANINYRINQGSSFSLFYNSTAQLPDLQQLQPVVDNSDPNRITIGNPSLKPQFTNNVTANYYFYKGISDRDMYAGGYINPVINEINEKTSFDSLGKSITIPVNISGNYSAGAWLGGRFPIFKRYLKLGYSFNYGFNNNIAFVNDEKNITKTLDLTPGLFFEKNSDNFDFTIGGNYKYTVPKQTISLQSNQPFYTYSIEGSIRVKLPKKFSISTDGKYTNNGNRANGYNINYFILNAQLSRAFLKTENLILSVEAYDILNQNISNQREITANKIVDMKTSIIRQYFLLKLLYKFTSQKTKVEDDFD